MIFERNNSLLNHGWKKELDFSLQCLLKPQENFFFQLEKMRFFFSLRLFYWFNQENCNNSFFEDKLLLVIGSSRKLPCHVPPSSLFVTRLQLFSLIILHSLNPLFSTTACPVPLHPSHTYTFLGSTCFTHLPDAQLQSQSPLVAILWMNIELTN